MRRVRLPVLALVLAVLTLAGGGAAVAAALHKTVTVSVEGEARSVSTFARTVSGALQSAGVAIGEHDTVAPAGMVALSEGASIVVRRGRLLSLTVDGQKRDVWVTATSVDEALSQIGLRAADAVLSASRSGRLPLSGFALDIRTPKPVSVLVDGRTIRRVSTAATVRDLLTEVGIGLAPTDRVSAPLTDVLVRGSVVRVVRVRVARSTERVTIGFATQRKADASMYKGSTKVLAAGTSGVLERTVAVTMVSGRLPVREVASSRVVVAAKPRIIAYGTKARPAAPTPSSPSYSPPSSGGLNWAALAQCESGGNPRAVSSTGRYRGLYQFSLSTWASVGGSGDPINASPAEQTLRAQILYSRSGRGPWPECGRHL